MSSGSRLHPAVRAFYLTIKEIKKVSKRDLLNFKTNSLYKLYANLATSPLSVAPFLLNPIYFAEMSKFLLTM